MATQSRNLRLVVPTPQDPFSTKDLADNWDKIDAAPGTHIYTSTTRPTFTASQPGRRIYETDTDLEWVWTGSSWVRPSGKGLLKKTDGTWAVGARSTDLVSASTTSVLVVAVNNVVVPPGRRTLMVQVVWSRAFNSSGYFYGRIHRSANSNGAPIIRQWAITGARRDGVNADEGGGGSMFTLENGGLAPGVYSWSFQIAAAGVGGTSTVQSSTASPTEISVIEL